MICFIKKGAPSPIWGPSQLHAHKRDINGEPGCGLTQGYDRVGMGDIQASLQSSRLSGSMIFYVSFGCLITSVSSFLFQSGLALGLAEVEAADVRY